MEEAIKQGSYYVSMVPRLKAMIAERNNVTPEHILIGSDQVLLFSGWQLKFQEKDIFLDQIYFGILLLRWVQLIVNLESSA